MKKIDVGQTISVLANIGVIAGIIFLAIEIRQNNQLLNADAIGAVFENRLTRQDNVINNERYAAVLAKRDRKEPLTDAEVITMRASSFRGFIAWQRDYFLYQQGLLPEQYFRANFGTMKQAFSDHDVSYSGFQLWEEWKDDATPDYREFVERCILSECETIPR